MGMDKEWLRVYDKLALKKVPEFMKGHWTKEGYAQLLRVTLSEAGKLKGVKNVLDVGCGVGRYCFEFSRLGLSVVGVDYSPLLIEEARKNYPKLHFEVQNGYTLKFADKSFDFAISIGALQCLEDYETFIKELCRVSAKYIIISTLINNETRNPKETLSKMLVDDTWPTRDYHPETLVELFAKNGFKSKVLTEEHGKLIKDGFFIVATRQ